MNILVTGGAGFVGSNLCRHLAQDSQNMVCSLDNYFTGSEENHVSGVRYIKDETKDIDSLVDFVPDLIYHLGEYSRVEQSFDDMELVLRYNKIGTFKVLEFVRKTRAKLIYAGSSTKFGDDGENKDASPYAWSKSSNTQLVQNYASWFGIDYAITYFYNVYGKGEISNGKYATLIARFVEKMRLKQTLDVVSPGTQRRNFTHVDDIVDALVLIGLHAHGDEYGIGAKEAYTVLDVAKMFGGQINMLDPRRGNRMDAELITQKTIALGWEQKRNLQDYIAQKKLNNWR